MLIMQKENKDAKITIPPIFHRLLKRKKIIDIIDNASLDEVICLIAPYGCGKTLSVVSWLKSHAHNAAWLTLDEADNSEVNLFAGLSAAIKRFTGWQGNLDDILSDNQYIENSKQYFENLIINIEKKDYDNILVIDNLQFINDPKLLRLVKNIVSALLKHWRLIIISRNELPPIFNDLMLKRHVCMITLNELSYSLEEISEFFSINDCMVSDENIEQIKGETEGWPAALNVIYMLSHSGVVSYDEAAKSYVMGFFETEIWDGLDKKIKGFLLRTAVLEKLTPALCHAVTDTVGMLPILRWLFVNGLFVTKLDEKDTYQYHLVFKNFLLDKLYASDINQQELYQKIAWFLFDQNEFVQAFPYFFKAGDLYGISRVFRIINSADIGLDKYLELTGCITELDLEKLQEYPLIVGKMALVHYALGNISKMQHLYNIFHEWIDSDQLSISPEEYGECVWEAGWLSYLNPAEPILDNQKHKEWLNYAEYDPRLKALHYVRAAVYRFPSMLRGIRDYCPMLNDLDAFVAQNIETGYSEISDEVSLWRIDIVRAEYAYELENFTLANELIRGIIIEVERLQITDLYFVCTAVLVKLMRATNNPKEINSLTSRLEAMIHNNGHTFLLQRFHAFEQRNLLAEGQIGMTDVFAEENKDYMNKPYFYLFYEHMTLVRTLLSTNDFNEAILILGNLEYLCHQYNRIMDLIEVNILKAIAHYGLGHEDNACVFLIDALNEAKKYGFIRIFSDDAKELWDVLNLVNQKINDSYIKNIIISCKKTLIYAGVKNLHKNKGHTGLTKTELKILKTLHVSMSYEEMALDNNIKLSTLKSHLHSIYSKLGVDNRTSAVIMAQEMKIIN